MDPTSHQYFIFEVAGGFCGIAWSDAGISRFQLPAHDANAARRGLLRKSLAHATQGTPPADVEDAIVAARRYFDGEAIDFSNVRLDLEGQDEFFLAIYAETRRVVWGRTTTYGALAKALRAGSQAARDVGQAMARNPVPLIIPCHRVLAAGGKVGGFSAPGGAEAKIHMLELEGVRAGPPKSTQQSFDL